MFSSIASKYIDFKIVTVLLKMYVEQYKKRQVYKNDYVEYVYHHSWCSISYQATMAQEQKSLRGRACQSWRGRFYFNEAIITDVKYMK